MLWLDRSLRLFFCFSCVIRLISLVLQIIHRDVKLENVLLSGKSGDLQMKCVHLSCCCSGALNGLRHTSIY